MALDFPNSPSVNDSFSAGGKTWVYNGTKWVLLSVSLNQTVADGAITAAKLASDSVTSAKIAADSITSAKIAAGAVGTTDLAANAVTQAKLASDAVATTNILDANITTAKIASDAVTTAKILDSNVTTAKIADDAVTQVKLADRVVGSAELDNLTLNAQTGTTYTLVLADAHKLVTQSNASAITTTIPPNSSVAFEIGDQVNLLQLGAGQVTVAAGAGVTIRSEGTKLKLKGQYAAATCIKIGSDEWVLVGNLSA